jgi:mannose-6-phosphate isomerase-like protein (cupin superfamily)
MVITSSRSRGPFFGLSRFSKTFEFNEGFPDLSIERVLIFIFFSNLKNVFYFNYNFKKKYYLKRLIMDYNSIKISNKYKLFSEQWQPKVIAEMNDYQFKIAKIEGEFIWHSHKETDETFIVIKGEIEIEFRDGFVKIKEGEMFVVPAGVEHKPKSKEESQIMLIEPKGVVNTGEEDSNNLTAKNDVWI